MNGKDKNEMYSFLNEYDGYTPTVVVRRLKNYFNIDIYKAEKIYKEWRKEYMKPKSKDY